MHRVIRPVFAGFVFLTPTASTAAAAVCATHGIWWATVLCAVLAVHTTRLIPRERLLRRQSRGQGGLYAELREVVTANVPLGGTRLLRRHGDRLFYIVGRLPGRFGTERVLIQRFDEHDMPEFAELTAGRLTHGVLVFAVFKLHPWYPAVTRETDGTTVTSDGHVLRVQPTLRPVHRADPDAHRLGVSTGLGHAGPAELRETIDALTRADIIESGPQPEPSW